MDAGTDASSMDRVRAVAVGGIVTWIVAGGVGAVGMGSDIAWLRDPGLVVSGAGLVAGGVAAALVSLRTGRELHAVAFTILAIAEAVMIGGHNRATDPGADAAFASGLALYVPGFLLFAAQPGPPTWSRLLAAAASVPFTVHAVLRAGGADLGSGEALSISGYVLAFAALTGYILFLVNPPSPARPPGDA